ncbi:TPA: hypothetical protein MHZ86_16245 [Klebsiella pneumoniae subsp. pneumoniae]|nr:hypothetical protein [Klebsiella pneumoniae subsp. pneumoniae]
MNDITELAQREKFEVWAHSQKLSLAYGDCGYAFSSTEMAWRAWMASSAELVEALDKSEKTSEARREAIDRAHNMFVRERDRANAAEEALEKAQKRISRLESRSVKLPKAMSIEGGAYCSAHAHYDSDGDYYDRTDVEEMLDAAGIKVEAE